MKQKEKSLTPVDRRLLSKMRPGTAELGVLGGGRGRGFTYIK